jgi:small nuclear ribonucleoprotein (snRNP)-like protein
MVLEDVTEMYAHSILTAYDPRLIETSDPADGDVKLPKILLNGNNICMVLDDYSDVQNTH